MEIGKLKSVPPEEMPDGFVEDLHRFTKIFQRGVLEAIAENKRLGIPNDPDSTLYSAADETNSPLVADEDS